MEQRTTKFYSVAEVLGPESGNDLSLAIDQMMEQWCEHRLGIPSSSGEWRESRKGTYYYPEYLRRPIESFARLVQMGIAYRPDERN